MHELSEAMEVRVKELLKEIRKLKQNKFVRVGSKKVSTMHLKCMDHDFLLRNVKEKRKMPESMGAALIYLIKNGYVRLKPTHAGYEFAKCALGAYEMEERRKHEIAKERRLIRSIVLKGKFELDKVVTHSRYKYNAVILGHYEDVAVEAFMYGRYAKLQKGDVMTFVGSGKLYDKLLNDIATVLKSPKGRLWVVKAKLGHIERYLERVRGRCKEV